MRKFVFCMLAGVLTALITARALLPESARAAAADGETYGYHISAVSLPITAETAGSAMLADLNGYYLFRTPTAKNQWTGVFAGKDLIVISAEDWQAPASPSRRGDDALYRLDRGGASVAEVWRTDWFQGSAGTSFAMLTGVIPTTLDDRSALVWAGEQDILLPYALPRMLAAEGYDCAAYIRENSQRAGFETLGFGRVAVLDGTAREMLETGLSAGEETGPLFAYWVWPEEECADALAALLDALEAGRRLKDTVICLVTGAESEDRGHIWIYGSEAADAVSRRPCSALDVTPTLLNLYGLSYDSRFLNGLDIFCTNAETGTARAVTPVVSLYGSAFSDWVSDAGAFCSAGSIFRQTADCFDSSEDVSAYVRDVSGLVYDRYIYARRAMECNYFQVALS